LKGFEMSVDYYFACHKCRKIIHVAQDGFSGFHFYSKEPGCLEALGKMLEECSFHPDKVAFVREQGPEWDNYKMIEWPNRRQLEKSAPDTALR
jgi:hypothetical protein